MRHVFIPSPSRQNGLCPHCPLSLSRTARDRSSANVAVNTQRHSFAKRQLAAIALMLDEEEKDAALSDRKKRM